MMLEILLNSAVRLLLVGAAAWLLLRIFRVRNPHLEALVWRMILLAGFSLPALLYWGMAPSFTSTLELPAVISPGAAPASEITATPGGWPTGPAASIYLAVALLLILRLAAGLAGTWRVSRAARRTAMPDDVRISARIRSPATFGTTVLLPADAQSWPAEKFDAVLEHERAHVASRDGYWSWLAQLHAAIFWFNPLAWWLERRLDALAETTSDDAVVAARHDPIAYAALLLDFARLPNSRSVVMSAAESNVSARIERLLAGMPPASALPRAARWAALALLVPIVVFAASTTRAAPQPAAAAASVPAGAKAQPPVDPQARGGSLLSFPNPDDYYPAVAKHEKVSGYAIVEVDLDAIGQLVNARVVEVEPADPRFGFADAALEIARNSQFGVLNEQPSTFKFKVKWLLED